MAVSWLVQVLTLQWNERQHLIKQVIGSKWCKGKKLQSLIYKSQIQQVGIQKIKSENQSAQARTPKQIHMRHFKKKNQKHAG